jgi:hypothetical protein
LFSDDLLQFAAEWFNKDTDPINDRDFIVSSDPTTLAGLEDDW